MPSCSVCSSVCPSRSCTLSKRINISSKFFHPEYLYVHSSFSMLNVTAILRRKPPHGRVESRWDTGVWKNRYFRAVSRCIAGCQCCDRQLLSTRGPQTVESSSCSSLACSSKRRSLLMAGDDDEVCMTRSFNVTPKTTEQHLIVRSDKSEAEVTKECARVLYY